MPVFRGVVTQRGRGFGSLLSGLMRNTLIPLAKTGIKQFAPVARRLGRKAVRQGTRQLSRAIKDVSRGQTVEQAVVNRLVKPALKVVQQQQRILQQRQRKPQTKKKKKKKTSGTRQRPSQQSGQHRRTAQTSVKRSNPGKRGSSSASKRARQVKDIFG